MCTRLRVCICVMYNAYARTPRFVRACVCLYLRMSVLNVCTCVLIACTYACLCATIPVRTYVCAQLFLYVRMSVRNYSCTYVCLYVRMSVRNYSCTYVSTNVRLNFQFYSCINICKLIPCIRRGKIWVEIHMNFAAKYSSPSQVYKCTYCLTLIRMALLKVIRHIYKFLI